MIYTLPVADVLLKETLLEDDFNSNYEGWEMIVDEDEKSFIKDSYYWMENKSDSRWMFYHKKMPITKGENFIINAEIELLGSKGYGQYGLVWGFSKPHEVLNRFTVSADANRFSVLKFDKDHFRNYHRYSGKFEKPAQSNKKQFFSIMRLDDYYYFFLGEFDRPVYTCHQSHLSMDGLRFGFYIEPGILIRCNKITVKRLITNQSFDGRLWMPVDDNLKPLGSELIRGN